VTPSDAAFGRRAQMRIAARCDEAGVVPALVTRRGEIEPLGSPAPAIASLLRSRVVGETVAAVWDRLAAGEVCEALSGMHLAAAALEDEPDRALLCVVLCDGFAGVPESQAALAEAGVDAADAARSVVARTDARAAADLARAARWGVEEVLAGERLEASVADPFADELASVYEQISVLYQLVRSMNSMENPASIVSLACGLLLETLDFGWFAACFEERPEISKTLSGRLISIGELPCGDDEFRALVSEVVGAGHGDRWSLVLTPDRDQLARRSGGEALLELIAHDGEAIGALVCGGRATRDPEISSVDIKLIDAVGEFLGVFHENVCRYNEQREMFLGTLHAMTGSVDAKDPYTRGHSDRVAHLGRQLALAAGLSVDEAEQVRIAGLLHDVGKIGVPERVLLKAGRLDDAEFEALKRHPVIGRDILDGVRPMAPMLPGVLHHHERWDGRGYPHGLAGERIPRIARILAVADAFDAMSSNRAYRDAMPRAKALEEIVRCAGTQFDPELAPLFVRLDFSRYDEMVQQAGPQSKAA